MKLILLLLLLLFLVGCTYTDIYTKEEIDNKVQSLQKQITNQNIKIDNLEANQLSSEDIMNLYNPKLIGLGGILGCPSKSDVDRWTDAYGDGDISYFQLRDRLRKYNECH